MTGKEKIEYVYDAILSEYESMVVSGQVTLRSQLFMPVLIYVDEQKQILDVLVQEKRIKYEIIRENGWMMDTETVETDHITASLVYKIDLLDLPVETALSVKHGVTTKSKRINIDKLTPEHYNKASGVLVLSAFDKVDVSNRGQVKRKNGQHYAQPWLLGLLFNNVNNLKSGVSFSKVLGVSSSIIDKNKVKKVRNTVQEINEKISALGGPNNLIKIQSDKVFVNNSYLL